MPARAPIGLETAQDRLERLNKPVFSPSLDLDIPEGYAPVSEKPIEAPVEAVENIPSEPTDELPADILEGYSVVSDELDDDLLSGYEVVGEAPVDTQMSSMLDDDGLVKLPQGVKAFTYSQDDMSERDELFNPINDFVKARYGIQAIENRSREEIVDTFLNNRRGVSAGNSIKAIAEVDWLMDAKKDPEKLLTAGKAYSIFEKMEGLTGEGVTWSEFGEGIKDYVGSVILDPVNLVGGFIGKAIGGTAVKTSVMTAEKLAMKEVTKQLMAGASKEIAAKAGTKVLKSAAKVATTNATKEVAEFSAKMVANKGLKKVLNKGALKEIATVTAFDAATNGGFEYLYQRALVDTDVQEEISTTAVGIAALSAMAMGTVQAGVVLKRGTSDTALITETVKKVSPKQIAKEMQDAIKSFVEKEPEGTTTWLQKVKSGDDITKGDTDFFIDVLLGIYKGEGENNLKGLAQIMQEGGYLFSKRTDDDKISNWIADFMKEELDQSDIDGIMKAFGGKAKRKNTKITPETFGDSFASKMNASARSMNSVMQVAKRLDVNVEDLDMDSFMKEALDLNLMDDIVLQKDKFKPRGAVASNISELQNKFIRSLVSHPSTSILNVLGYGAAAGLDISTDVTLALFKGGRGTLQSVLGFADAGAKNTYVAKQLLLASKDRVKFAFDNDMTYAAYKSALQNNTGALDKLNRTLSGGVEISNTVDQMTTLGKGAFLQDKSDSVINVVQRATFVNAQDAYTKSQDYVGQMNKQLRLKFGKSWNEFYTSPEAVKIMATKEYKQMEIDAVAKTMENTFSKSYKNRTKLGELAGFVEDARNIPGLGFMVPFGRFFNNTIDFGIKNTPVLNIAVKKISGKYNDVPIEELAARGAVVTGLVYTMAQDEQENRKAGLGLYDNIVDGQVVSQQYDYPISLFKAAARVVSYHMAGEEVPEEILAQIGKDFGGGGLTRNLTKTTGEIADFTMAILKGEIDNAYDEGLNVVTEISAQAISGFVRPLEPIDTAFGLIMDIDQSPKDLKQINNRLNRTIAESFKYVDSFTDFLTTGEGMPTKQSSVAGEAKQQSAKNVGVRTVELTNTQRIMNLMGLDQWKINAPLSKDKKRMIPEAVNEYQRQMYQSIEAWSTTKMESMKFRNLPQDELRIIWKDKMKEVKELTKLRLVTRYDGTGTTLRSQYDLVSKFSADDIKKAMADLELGDSMGDLSEGQLMLIEAELNNADTIKRMRMDPTMF